MVVITLKQPMALVQAALFFGTASAGRVYVTGRAVSVSNTTTSSSLPTPSAVSASAAPVLNFCYNDTAGLPLDCSNSAYALEFDPISSNPYNTAQYPYNIVPPNPSAASYCDSLWSSSAAAFFATDPVITQTGTYTLVPFTYSGSDGQHGETVTALTTLTSENFYFKNTFSWVPTATQCCLNCTISGGAIQVMVWPTPAPSPAISILVDSAADFTFTSPSIYVVFESIGATNLCGGIGNPVINKTLAFAPEALSTQRNYFAATAGVSDVDLNEDYCTHATPNNAWSTFNYADAEAGRCTDVITSWWSYYGSNDTTMYSDYAAYSSAATAHISCGFGCVGQPINDFTCVYNPCSPFVSVPTQVYSLNPAYVTCVDGIKAFFDPPYTLTAGGSLVPFSSVPASSSTASPAGTPQPVQASPTSIPSPVTQTPTPSSTPVAVGPPKPPISSSDPTDPGTTSTQRTVSPNTSIKDPADPKTSIDPTVIVATPTTPSDPTTPQAGNSPSTSPVQVATIGSVTVSQISSNVIVGGSQTLTPGGVVTASGTTFFLDPSNSLVVDGSTKVLPAPNTPAAIGTLVTTNGQTGLVVGSQTITPGAPAVVVSGTTISLASGGGAAVVNGVTTSLSPIAAPSLLAASGTTLLVVGGQTVLPGSSAVTVGGMTYSLATSGNALVIDGTSRYLVASQTLVAGGPAITISGTVVSLQSGGQSVVVGGSTEAISSFVAGATSSGLGGAIVSIGGFTSSGGASSTGYNGTAFTGAATKSKVEVIGISVVACIAGLGIWDWLL